MEDLIRLCKRGHEIRRSTAYWNPCLKSFICRTCRRLSQKNCRSMDHVRQRHEREFLQGARLRQVAV
jgi:hypothetical protein